MKKHASGPPHAVEASRAAQATALDQKWFVAQQPAALCKANKEGMYVMVLFGELT